ncbi:MAG TPA: ArsR family transcriptional regulator [Roseiflexaceae bacterium]|nr:ArsR family transcriptional regulator [Roseiflexaceae bacterium]
MTLEHREQGETRQQILNLLRRQGALTAAELSESLGIGTVGVRQHLALLERDSLVHVSGVRRGVGRPSHLYALTDAAAELFPRRYDGLALDALALVADLGGEAAVGQLFDRRRQHLHEQYRARLEGKNREEQIRELAAILNEQGYMCECSRQDDGSYVLTEHNCPIECVAREYHQACAQELTLYEDLIGAPIVREETMAEGGTCCRYRISP